uniref:Peptidase S1 domain-containing protein n=1 Tax=Anopheles atroparvus TaxID=41427 RepID=A0AAG5CUX6_ANOAO
MFCAVCVLRSASRVNKAMLPVQGGTRRISFVLLLFCVCCVAGERISAQKCNEYRKVIADKQSVIFLTIDPIEITYDVYNCSNDLQLIVGGVEAKYGEFPHQAMLGFPLEANPRKFDFKCGGSLISEQHVLTAAHCFAHGDPTVVRLGEYDISTLTGDEEQIPIERIRRHPDYPSKQPYNDIALVRLKSPVRLSKYIRPACLWDTEYRNTTKFTATGFGHEEFGGTMSKVLRKVQLAEYPAEDCAEQFRTIRRLRAGLSAGQMCVGSIGDEITDTCQGDSGGPLQTLTYQKSCTYHIVGITSVGGACGTRKSKAIYTKVSHYIDWIEDNVWGPNAL